MIASTTIFRNSPFLSPFGAQNTEIHNRKCILSVKSDFSELREVGKLKLSTNDVNIALKRHKQGFSDICYFYPFLGPETLQFVTENAHYLTTAIFRNQ